MLLRTLVSVTSDKRGGMLRVTVDTVDSVAGTPFVCETVSNLGRLVCVWRWTLSISEVPLST